MRLKSSNPLRFRIILAGIPPTTKSSSTDLHTTAEHATTTPLEIVTFGKIVERKHNQQ